MKQTAFTLFVTVLIALAQAGCKHKVTYETPKTLTEGIPQLQAAFAKAPPAVQDKLYTDVIGNIRYERYEGALMSLDQMSTEPSLGAQQKKLVTDVMGLLKAEIDKRQNTASAPH